MEGRRRQRAPGARSGLARLPRLARPGAARRGRLRRHCPLGPRQGPDAGDAAVDPRDLVAAPPPRRRQQRLRPAVRRAHARRGRARRSRPAVPLGRGARRARRCGDDVPDHPGRLPRLRRERRVAPWRRPRRRPPPAALAQPRARARPARCHPGRGRQPGDAGDGSLLHLRRRRAADGTGVLHRPARRIEQRRVERLVRPPRLRGALGRAGRPRLRSLPTTTSPRSCCRSMPRCGRAARPKCRHRCCRA